MPLCPDGTPVSTRAGTLSAVTYQTDEDRPRGSEPPVEPGLPLQQSFQGAGP